MVMLVVHGGVVLAALENNPLGKVLQEMRWVDDRTACNNAACRSTAADVAAAVWFDAVTTAAAAAASSFVYELAIAQPNWVDVGKGLVPTGQLFTNPEMLFIAIGILGATVMPHNLYLHSAVIQTRAWDRNAAGRRGAIRYGTLDSSLSLLFAFFINAAILILAGAAFYYGDVPHRCV
jgi:hypothetical protein